MKKTIVLKDATITIADNIIDAKPLMIHIEESIFLGPFLLIGSSGKAFAYATFTSLAEARKEANGINEYPPNGIYIFDLGARKFVKMSKSFILATEEEKKIIINIIKSYLNQ